jgi:hypothetical protein
MKKLLGLFLALLALAPPVFSEDARFVTHTFQSAAEAQADGTALVVDKYTMVALQVTISDTATVTFEGSQDGTTYASKVCVSVASTSAALVTSATATGTFQCNIAGLQNFRARISAYTGGTITVTGRATTAVFGGVGGGGGGSITVAEEDGDPSVDGVSTLTVPNGLLTDDGSGAVSLASPTVTLDSAFDNGKVIDGATSEANGFCVGGDAASKRACLWHDAATGLHFLPDEASDTKTEVMTDFTWTLHDVEGDKAMVTADPDAIGAGSGTVTMNTSEQLVASNLGVEFTDSDTNPACAAGNYNIYADTSETKLKKCQNGTTSDLSSGGATIVRKTSDETLDGQTIQDDNELLFAVATNSFYTFFMQIDYASTATADFKIDFTMPANTTGRRQDTYVASGTATCDGQAQSVRSLALDGLNNSINGAGASTVCTMRVWGNVVTTDTAGNVTFQWAQTNDDGANVATVYANSYIIYQRL